MSERDNFIEEFKQLLATLPPDSLADWLYGYRQVAHTMGVEILRRFPEAITGPSPGDIGADPVNAEFVIVSVPEQDGGQSGGMGGRPSILCKLSCLLLDMYPEVLRQRRR